MGNSLGCVRAPKEEYDVGSNKLPLRAQSKDFKGRRYFQRKKRKSEDLRSVISTGTLGNCADFQDDCTGNHANQEKDSPFRQASISKDVHAGPVNVLTEAAVLPLCSGSAYSPKDLSADQQTSESCRSGVEGELHGVSPTSRITPAKQEGKVLRRTVSLGAVEHKLQTPRGNDRTASEEKFSRIICESGSCRERRMTLTSCPYTEIIPAKCVSRQHKVKETIGYWLFLFRSIFCLESM